MLAIAQILDKRHTISGPAPWWNDPVGQREILQRLLPGDASRRVRARWGGIIGVGSHCY